MPHLSHSPEACIGVTHRFEVADPHATDPAHPSLANELMQP